MQRARLSAGEAKRSVVSPPAAETELRIWVPAWARRVAVSSFADGGSRAKYIAPPARATNAWARDSWLAISCSFAKRATWCEGRTLSLKTVAAGEDSSSIERVSRRRPHMDGRMVSSRITVEVARDSRAKRVRSRV